MFLNRRLEGSITNLPGAEKQPGVPRRLTPASGCFGSAGAVLRLSYPELIDLGICRNVGVAVYDPWPK